MERVLEFTEKFSTRIKKTREQSAMTLYQKGLDFEKENKRENTKKALEMYEASIALNPTPEALLNAANLLRKQPETNTRRKKILRYYLQALELRPTYTYAEYNLGAFCYEQGQYELAIEHMKKVIVLVTEDDVLYASACLYLGITYDKEHCRNISLAIKWLNVYLKTTTDEAIYTKRFKRMLKNLLEQSPLKQVR